MRPFAYLLVPLVAVAACGENPATTVDAASTDTGPVPACADDVDNDGDGLTDYPNDPGCAVPHVDDEGDACPSGAGCPQCGDDIDNDGNGKIDFPDDSTGCTSAADPIEFTDDPNACGAGMAIKPLPMNGNDTGGLVGSMSNLTSPCGGGNNLPAIAYVFHLSTPRVMIATTDDTATVIDTVLDLRSSMCAAPTSEVACHDDLVPSGTGMNKKSRLVQSLPAGTYYLIVGGKTTADTGTYNVNVKFLAGEGAVCGNADDCGPGLVCRVPVGQTQMMCAKPVCRDGLDDDADGIIDWPNDPGCVTDEDDDESDVCNTNPQDPACPECANGIDDNANGDTDYPAESNCTSAGSTSESCVQAEPVGVINGPMIMGTTVGAKNDYKPTCGSTANTAGDVVYRLDLPVPMATLNLNVAGFDSAHALLGSSCKNPAIACSDPPLMSRTNVPAGTYYVVVDGYGSATGAFTLTTSGTIAGGQSCEGPLFQAGAFTCAAGFTCAGTPGSRICTAGACNDGLDNDGDGKADVADPGCTGGADNDETDDCHPTMGPNCPQCADTVDNDADGKIDYPMDTSCLRASSNSETCSQSEPIGVITQPVTTGTTAGMTNDFTPTCGGGTSHSAPDLAYRIDVPSMATLNLDLVGFDGAHSLLNNTCAGTAIACSDPPLMARTNVAAGTYYVVVDGWGTSNGPFTLTTSGTVSPGASCEGALFQNGAFTCTNGYACGGTPGTRTCIVAACNDTTDNDGDGKIDINDPGCASSSDGDETDDCYPTVGPNCPACSDAIDNDMDGSTDYPGDTSCLRASGTSESCAQTEPTLTLTMPMTMGTTAGAVHDGRVSCSSSTNTAGDLTYRLDLPAMSSLTVENTQAWDGAVALFNSSCGGTALGCGDIPEKVTVANLAAGTYYYWVDGWSTGSGAFTIKVSGTIQSGASCESALAQSGALTCPAQHTCAGPMGMRRCLGSFACNDGMDNDSDGKTDFPLEPGCTSASDNDESDSCMAMGVDCPQCGNGIDDDLDMKADYPMDTRCPNASFFHEQFCTTETFPDMFGPITTPTTIDTLAGRGANYQQSCQTNSGNDVAYGLVLPVAVDKLEIDTLGSAGDTVISLWNAACSTEIECDDDSGGGLKSRIKRNNVAAGTYAIQVDCLNNTANHTTFNLNVKGTVPPGTACTDPLFTSGVLVCPAGTSCTAGTCQ